LSPTCFCPCPQPPAPCTSDTLPQAP
jgi:hypothetical protein